jgi:hypothetical protein
MAAGKITGIVKDRATDQPQKDAVVTARVGGNVVTADTTGADGAFTLTGLEAGKKYAVTVALASGKLVFAEDVEIGVGGVANRTVAVDPAAAPVGPAVPAGAFDELAKLVRERQDDFARNADVNLSEARYFQQLYMVGNYVLARVVRSVEELSDAEERVSMNAAAWEAWWDQNSNAILALQRLIREEPLTVQRLMQQVRSAFDLGTEPADRVNAEFKQAFRDLVTLCADDRLAVDYETASQQGGWEETKTQEVVSHYRKVKRAVIHLTELMSRAGRPDMRDHVNKWAGVIAKALPFLRDAARNAAGDIDDQHVWGFVANLNGIDKAQIDPHIEHAPKGTKLMGDALKVYQLLNGDRENFTKEHLRNLFHVQKIDTYRPDGTLGQDVPGIVLHENASVLLEYWPAAWR